MCDLLVNLCNFVESSGAGSRTDVIRAACTRCDKIEVCPVVTDREFDVREASLDRSDGDRNGSTMSRASQ